MACRSIALALAIASVARAEPQDRDLKAFNQAGADELARICAEPSNQDAKVCKDKKKRCDEIKAASAQTKLLACEPPAVKAGIDTGAPKPVPNPRAFPDSLVADVTACKLEGGNCVTLDDFRARHPGGFKTLSAWCLTRRIEDDEGGFDGAAARAVALVCGAIEASTDANTRPMAGVPASYLLVLQDATAKQTVYDCDGFGLTLPFVRIRYPSPHNADVTGPLAAGIGGGYYWAAACHATWSWGVDAFAYSEGIDLTRNKVQFGVGGTIGVVAYNLFRFGVGLGYDLYRQNQAAGGGIVRNGVFALENFGRPSISYLITLSIQSKPEQKPATQGTP